MALSNKIKIQVEPDQSDHPYREVRRSEVEEKEVEVEVPVFKRRKFDPNKISPAMLRDHCRKHELYMIPRFNTVLYLHFMVRIYISTFHNCRSNLVTYFSKTNVDFNFVQLQNKN